MVSEKRYREIVDEAFSPENSAFKRAQSGHLLRDAVNEKIEEAKQADPLSVLDNAEEIFTGQTLDKIKRHQREKQLEIEATERVTPEVIDIIKSNAMGLSLNEYQQINNPNLYD